MLVIRQLLVILNRESEVVTYCFTYSELSWFVVFSTCVRHVKKTVFL